MSITARLGLKTIEPGQLHKEISHNEAIERLDMIVQPVVISSDVSQPPASAAIGDCFIVGPSATGDWTGRDGEFAMMGSGGWVYLAPFSGLEVRDEGQAVTLRHDGASWQIARHRGSVEDQDGHQVIANRQPSVGLPAGGSVQDLEARAAISALVGRLEAHGLIETN